MNQSSRVKRVTKKAAQIIGLLGLFILVGFLLPIYTAPYIAKWLPITTPYEAARERMSVQITDRNVSHGERFSIGVSDPASSVQVSSFSYPCSFPEITIAYVTRGDIKEIPCDTALELPSSVQHEFMLFTSKSSVTYVPVELMLENQNQIGSISIIVAGAASGADEKSALPDSFTATLQSFPSANE